MSHFFPGEDKVHPVDSEADVLVLLRLIASQTPKNIAWREQRAYLLAEEATFDAYEHDPVR